ncbi:MAG TPA: hypothetical protein VJA19_00420 [Pseudomonas sp.]|nr:hypothetical protein [Pseudomonas sp.]
MATLRIFSTLAPDSAAPQTHVWPRIGYLLLLLSLSLFLLEAWTPVEQMDDAFISYRYAQNLLDGQGLVFNPGERVEGYTNLSWTLLVAGGMALGLPASLAGHWLGLLAGLWLLWASYRYAAFLLTPATRWLAGLAPGVLLASNSFAGWSGAGLETSLFAATAVSALHAYGRGRMGMVLLWTVLASLTRPEGVLLAGLLLGWDWLVRELRERPRHLLTLLRLSWPALGFAAYLLLHTAFRLYYYGDYVPNTFHAKVGGVPLNRGFSYVYHFLIDGPGLLLIPALIAALKYPAYRMGFVYLTLTLAYSVAVGGDAFRLGRFLLPVLPVLIAGALVGACWLFYRQRALGLALGLTLPASILWALYSPWPANFEFSGLEARPWPVSAKRLSARKHDIFINEAISRQLVAALGQLQPPVKRLAAIGIGQIGFFGMHLEIIDVVGLTDRHIARSERRIDAAFILPGHQRTDADYVFSRKPDALIIPRKDSPKIVLLPATLDLWRDPRLSAEYHWDETLMLYLRNPELRGKP